MGGWINKDPMGLTAGDTNTGRYCGNSPMSGTDPSGYWTIKSETTKRIHEKIVEAAAKSAGYTGSKYAKFVKDLVEGTRWIDAPDGTNVVATVYLRKDQLEASLGQWPNTVRSHFGSRQWLHAMVPYTDPPRHDPLGWNAQKMQETLANWICAQYRVALQLSLGWTINWPGDWPSSAGPHTEGAQLGMALHTLADLYCPSHVKRDDYGRILMFRDYNAQDKDRHEAGDDPDSDAPDVKKWYGMAINKSATLLSFYKAASGLLAKTPKENQATIINNAVVQVYWWLINDGPLTLASGATCGGDEGWYKKTSGSKVATALDTWAALA